MRRTVILKGNSMDIDGLKETILQIDYVSDCVVEIEENGWWKALVKTYLANDDGSKVEKARSLISGTTEMIEGLTADAVAELVAGPYQRCFKEKHMGFARFANAAEIDAYLRERAGV